MAMYKVTLHQASGTGKEDDCILRAANAEQALELAVKRNIKDAPFQKPSVRPHPFNHSPWLLAFVLSLMFAAPAVFHAWAGPLCIVPLIVGFCWYLWFSWNDHGKDSPCRSPAEVAKELHEQTLQPGYAEKQEALRNIKEILSRRSWEQHDAQNE